MTRRPTARRISLALLTTATILGGTAVMAASKKAALPTASTQLLAADGSAKGMAKIVQTAKGLQVSVEVSGIAPGIHGAHIHMTGQCTAPDFASAGGHWNPTMRQHGHDNPQGMHMGDMPNLTVGADGTGKLSYVVKGGTLAKGANPLLDADGAAVVIHANPDDMKSDPAGNAGGRIACGVLAPA